PGSELLLDRETVWLRREGEPARELPVRSARAHKGMVLLTFERVVGRDAAEALRGVEVCVPRADLPEPDEDEYYHVDLIGLRAVGPDGAPRGLISNVIPYPSVDCVVLESETERWELPIVAPYVGAIDLGAGTVV